MIMPRPMNAEETVALINDRGRSAIVATLRKDGSPHSSWNPVAYVDGELYTYADPRSVCYRNLKRDPRISIAISSGSEAAFIQGKAVEVGRVSELLDGVVKAIFSAVPRWIPTTSVTYASLPECRAFILAVKMSGLVTYKSRGS